MPRRPPAGNIVKIVLTLVTGIGLVTNYVIIPAGYTSPNGATLPRCPHWTLNSLHHPHRIAASPPKIMRVFSRPARRLRLLPRHLAFRACAGTSVVVAGPKCPARIPAIFGYPFPSSHFVDPYVLVTCATGVPVGTSPIKRTNVPPLSGPSTLRIPGPSWSSGRQVTTAGADGVSPSGAQPSARCEREGRDHRWRLQRLTTRPRTPRARARARKVGQRT